jgi:hypothetical protein
LARADEAPWWSPWSNRFLLAAQLGALAVHVGALYLGVTQFALRVEPIPLEAWWRIVAISTTVLAVVEVDKAIRRRGPDRRPQRADAETVPG